MVAECATRGCHEPVAAPGGHPLTKCVRCLTGQTRLARMNDRVAAVELFPQEPAAAGELRFRIPVSPMPQNHAWRIMRGHLVLNPKATEWKRIVGDHAAAAQPPGWNRLGSFEVEIASTFSTDTADADGPVKLILDAMQGIAYANDRQVVRLIATKAVAYDAPHVVVSVRRRAV